MPIDTTLEKRRDTDATAAIVLAVFLLVFPVMGDVAAMFVAMRKYLPLVIWMTGCYGVVIFPWVRSLLRHRREPGVWDGRGRLIATGIILGIHALWIVAISVYWLATT